MGDATICQIPGLDRLHPIFAHCVDDRPMTRYDLTRPHERDGHIYATNGILAIRTPTPDGWDVPNAEGRFPDIDDVFAGAHRPDPTPLPAVDLRPCRACMGTLTRPARECPACDGEGEVDCDCDCPYCSNEVECPECDGKGVVGPGPCDECEMTGLGGDGRAVDVGGVLLRDHFVALLAKYGAEVYLPVDPGSRRHNAAVVRFVVGNVEGRVMPITSGDSDPETEALS